MRETWKECLRSDVHSFCGRFEPRIRFAGEGAILIVEYARACCALLPRVEAIDEVALAALCN